MTTPEAPPATAVEDNEGSYALRVVEIPPQKWKRRYRSVAFQMVILALLAFSGPSMSNALSSLGGGGLATPWTANTASAVQYSMSAWIAMLGGPLISALGIPLSCKIGAVGFPLSGSGFYVNSKYGVQWYLIFAKALYGITSSFLYVAEASAMISYPEDHRRGFYVSIWVVMRNVGSIIAGAITLGLNIARNGAGGVSTRTYLVFLGLECVGLPAALLMTSTRKVIRSDGWGVPILPRKSWRHECVLLFRHHLQSRTLRLIPAYILTYFGDGIWGTYNATHLSVRGRALAAFLAPVLAVIFNPLFGKLLDARRWGPRRKGFIAFWVYAIPSTAMLIWVMINIRWLNHQPSKLRLDFAHPTTSRYVIIWFPSLIYSVNSWMLQTLVYWVLGHFASDVAYNARVGGVFRSWETVGQAISYGISSKTHNPDIPFGIYWGLYAITLPLFWTVLRELPVEDRVPNIMNDQGEVVGSLGDAKNTATERTTTDEERREIPI